MAARSSPARAVRTRARCAGLVAFGARALMARGSLSSRRRGESDANQSSDQVDTNLIDIDLIDIE
ncbi:hypothetical protein ACQF36_16020 [Streptomyces sp. Marseille-Q5077]|uniref:hypothetical protein n=1 Tax=Streptomyces sp. Marseille-Q5077 TaxID=3418995 RepID=UPI003CFC2A59